MRVVLDTCILFSALRSSQGASHRILAALPRQIFTPVVSIPLFFEYEDVLHRPGQFPRLTRKDIDDFLDYVALASEQCRINFLWRPFLSDPGDDLVLEAAFSGEAKTIVTYNTRDFAGSEKLGVGAITPAAFLKTIHL